MKLFAAWYDNEGRVKVVAKNGPTTELARYAGKIEMEERINPNDYYVDLGTLALTPYPPKPTDRAIWNGSGKHWLLDIDQEKAAKRIEITAARNKAETQGFTYLGKTFDSDAAAIRRINVAVLAALNTPGSLELEWTCQDNSVITLNKNQLLVMPTVMAAQGDAIHKKGKRLKTDIDNAATVEEVLAITWD